MKVKVSWGLELILSGFHQCNNKFHLNRPSYSWFIRTVETTTVVKTSSTLIPVCNTGSSLSLSLSEFFYWASLPPVWYWFLPYQILSLDESTLLGKWVKTWFRSFGALQTGSEKLGPRVINHSSLPGTSLVSVMKVISQETFTWYENLQFSIMGTEGWRKTKPMQQSPK